MKAALRQEIADRCAELAVDAMQDLLGAKATIEGHARIYPEELLEVQHELEDVLYRELNQWQ